MFGTKLRTWMEAHLVRPRKKQQRKINMRAKTIPEVIDENKQESEDKNKIINENEIAEKSGSTYKNGGLIHVTREKIRDGPRSENIRRHEETGGLANLSSPESAYSTGYSTDGTSPGASVPPEYYINLRTGTHYVAPAVGAAPLTPKSAHRRATVRPRPPLPESSTEEDIAADSAPPKPHKPLTPKGQRKEVDIVHRRTESYDECHYKGNVESPYGYSSPHHVISPQQHISLSPPPPVLSPPPCSSPRPCNSPRPCASPRPSESPRLCSSPHPCASPHPSVSPLPGASPRQRNRIRTNPWHPPPHDDSERKFLHPNIDTADSSSTLSSNDKPNFRSSESRRPLMHSGVPCRDVVTTCLSSIVPQPCRHHPLSSSSSAPSSGSDRHPNTSDFSEDETQEDDDATLNEILGKYDESYIYEKETDILSDTDPTDADQLPGSHDCNGNSSDMSSLGPNNEIDFIDNGSLCEQMFANPDRKAFNMNQHVSSVNSSTPEVKRRHCSRTSRKQRLEGSQASSRASSRCNRRIKRNISRKSDDMSSSSEYFMENPHEKIKHHHHSARERKFSAETSPCKYSNGHTEKVLENRVVNLNKVLIDRLINNQRCGTRSADTTPILKRHSPLDYNGKYLKNPHVSKLISSNSSLMERRPSLEMRPSRNLGEKRRSNSLTAHGCQSIPKSVDNDGDLKCRQLIREAENILEDYQVKSLKADYLSPTLSTRSAILPSTNGKGMDYLPIGNCLNQEIQSQISLLQEKISRPLIKADNEDGILKTISKTLERIMVRERKCDKNKNSLKSKKKTSVSDSENNKVSNINLSIPTEVKDFSLSPSNYRRSNSFVSSTNSHFIPSPSFRRPSGRFEPGEINKIKPKMRGVDYIRVMEPPSYSPILSRVSPYLSPGMRSRRLAKHYPETRNYASPFDSKPPLTTFKSFDLGNQGDHGTQMCPQSEPVKRKVYVGSSTFGKLQKSLMRNEADSFDTPDLTTECLKEENASLKEKVVQLRMERLKVEARVKEAQNQIDKLNYSETSSRC